MKKVELSVEFMDGENLEYAVLFVGFATRRFIYAKKVSYYDAEPDRLYIRVKKSDAQRALNVISSVDDYFESWEMTVEDAMCLHDPKVEKLEDPEMIWQVDQHVEFYEKLQNDFLLGKERVS